MTYTETTESYNDRRYGKPWMAIVGKSMTKEFQFIDWNGRPGNAGEFCFDAEPGTILAYGQKDIRKGRGGVDGYQICMPEGTLPTCSDATVLALLKLPVLERVAVFAARALKSAEAEISAITPDMLADGYWDQAGQLRKVADCQARIARYSALLAATESTGSIQ